LNHNTTRPAAVAGIFYPSDTEKLEAQVKGYLGEAKTDVSSPKAMIVPHAGYVYSGQVAARAYATLLNRKQPITRVIAIGPCHRVAFEGIATSTMTTFETPLGLVPLMQKPLDALADLPGLIADDLPHMQEHCLEVQLPFLQLVLGEFELLPLVIGHSSAEQVAAVIEMLWDDPETLFVISSDLSHFHDYQTASVRDLATTSYIEALKGDRLNSKDACGYLPVQGLLQIAQKRNLQALTLDVRNSGDTAGSKDRVVGYGAYIFH